MTRKQLIAVIVILAAVLALCLTIALRMSADGPAPDPAGSAPSQTTGTTPSRPTGTTAPGTSVPQTSVPETSVPETSVPGTSVPETTAPIVTEPPVEQFTLTFVGDCTLGTMPDRMNSATSFVGTIGKDYHLPFQYVSEYFSTDDCTFVNLESVLADDGVAADKLFTFRGPTDYGQILTTGSVELVTLANNHTYDFGVEGYLSTKNVLDAQGTAYVEANSTAVYTTESGLTVGVYAVYFNLNTADLIKDIEAMRQQGAEVIVAAVHWGEEGKYNPNNTQTSIAQTLIDNGVDIVWGHHPHVLQKIEYYNGGVIYYSLGNFSFGGNHNPYDYDTAVVQQQILRDPQGNISLGELTVVPCSLSSVEKRNDFQPTPYEAGSEAYDRVLSKLSGTYEGKDIDLSYRDELTKPTEPETAVPGETEPSTEPTQPTEPAEPSEPPTQPTDPTEPTNPTEPTEPTDSTEPEATEPESPVPDTSIPETSIPETTVPSAPTDAA